MSVVDRKLTSRSQMESEVRHRKSCKPLEIQGGVSSEADADLTCEGVANSFNCVMSAPVKGVVLLTGKPIGGKPNSQSKWLPSSRARESSTKASAGRACVVVVT